jgi:hypothetical protein
MPQTFLLLLPLAMVALVLWPMFAAVLEIFKALRSPVTQPRTFVISKNGATNWNTERLRLSVLLACAAEAAFIVFLTVFCQDGIMEFERAVEAKRQEMRELHRR